MAKTRASETQRVDAVFRALASPPRREILRLLASGECAEDDRCCGVGAVCACVFSDRLGIGAPTVSHHMKTLLEAGLITAEKRGLWVYYRLRPEGFEPITRELSLLNAPGGCSASSEVTTGSVGRRTR
jgi:ArsR family transcriptional regulator, arsenate/arsenite/antimonite-responsive transcriptional repressor